MTDTVVVEGQVKFRDGKKWKSRWVVLRKPSPVADCLSLQVFKERRKKKDKERGSGHKERLNVTLEGICGVEPGPGYDGVAYTLSILCLGYSLTLGFHSREALAAWDARLRYSLGEVHRFSVTIQPGTKLESGSASLHLCNNLLVLARDPPPAIIGHWKLPPAVIGHWKLSELRRYGAVTNGFVFEGGTRCGYWAGVFFLSCSEGEQISFLFDCIVRGISPTRTPHGVRPALPVDPSAKPSSSEEQINEEASELEKRLSMLSQCSRPSSTASTYSGSTSVAGDDHSSVSSSSSSQSDASYGSGRLHMMWPEAVVSSSRSSYLSTETLSAGGPPFSSTAKGSSGTNPDERLYAAVMGSAAIGPTSSSSSSKGQQLRGLLDSGRQSSLDSGIGIVASGSQSSYSGSFSSYTGSLDTASQGGGEEFGSVASIPPPQTPHPPPPPPSVGIPQRISNNNTSCSSCSSRSSSSASRRHSEEYQSPSMLMLQYDVPRRLVQSLKDAPAGGQGLKDAPAGGQGLKDAPAGGQGLGPCHNGPAERRATMHRSLSWGSERAPSVASVERCTPRPALLLTDGAVCEITQCSPDVDNYITAEQWRSARNRGLTEVTNLPESESSQPSAHTPDICLFVREPGDDGGSDASCDAGSALESPEESSHSYLPASSPPPPPPCTLSLQRQPSAPGQRSSYEQTDVSKRRDLRLDEYRTFLQSSHETPTSFLPATRLFSSNSANYVNIPISPMAAKASRELLYMELDLHERRTTALSALSPGANAVRGSTLELCRPRGGSIRYAHIDLVAMETALRVGAEHAQGREDRLPQLEGRRRAAPN